MTFVHPEAGASFSPTSKPRKPAAQDVREYDYQQLERPEIYLRAGRTRRDNKMIQVLSSEIQLEHCPSPTAPHLPQTD